MKTQRSSVAALLALGFSLVGFSPAEAFIANGEVAAKGDPLAKFTVLIQNNWGGGQGNLCTGTLITSRIVLTAAHCALDGSGRPPVNPAQISVAFNDFSEERMNARSRSTRASAVIVHEDYLGSDGQNRARSIDFGVLTFRIDDLALILLSEEAPAGFTPLQKIATRKEIDTYSSTLVSAGYGCESSQVQPCPRGRLKSAKVSLAENSRFYSYVDTLYQTGQTQHGDSGGPLLIKHPTQGYMLAGVHSSVPRSVSNVKWVSATSVRVADYKDFISDSIADLGGNPAQIYGVSPVGKSSSLWPQTK